MQKISLPNKFIYSSKDFINIHKIQNDSTFQNTKVKYYAINRIDLERKKIYLINAVNHVEEFATN